jgi:hypothetical protein
MCLLHLKVNLIAVSLTRALVGPKRGLIGYGLWLTFSVHLEATTALSGIKAAVSQKIARLIDYFNGSSLGMLFA